MHACAQLILFQMIDDFSAAPVAIDANHNDTQNIHIGLLNAAVMVCVPPSASRAGVDVTLLFGMLYGQRGNVVTLNT
jgi:hypothetical protein